MYKEEEQIKLLQLCLSAGLNTEKKRADFFEISIRTWKRWMETAKLKEHQMLALKSKTGLIDIDQFEDYKVKDNCIYSPTGQFAFKHEIDNMWLYRLIKHTNGTKLIKDKSHQDDISASKVPSSSNVIDFFEFKQC